MYFRNGHIQISQLDVKKCINNSIISANKIAFKKCGNLRQKQ